jgi:hypothetical protein
MLDASIGVAERELLVRVLRYSPSGEVRRQLGTVLIDPRAASDGVTLRWGDIPPAAARLLWNEVVWFRGLFTLAEKPILDRIEACLAVIGAQQEGPVTTASP